jgi:hypothetical protein
MILPVKCWYVQDTWTKAKYHLNNLDNQIINHDYISFGSLPAGQGKSWQEEAGHEPLTHMEGGAMSRAKPIFFDQAASVSDRTRICKGCVRYG